MSKTGRNTSIALTDLVGLCVPSAPDLARHTRGAGVYICMDALAATFKQDIAMLKRVRPPGAAAAIRKLKRGILEIRLAQANFLDGEGM